MTQSEYSDLLKQSLKKLEEAEKWLDRSYTICKNIDMSSNLKDGEFDALETLTSRFSRASDMILQKLFRNINKLEFAEGGTLIDVLNRAEQRELIKSIDQFREIRELRNEISHDDSLESLTNLFSSVLQHTPELFKIIQSIRVYCRNYI